MKIVKNSPEDTLLFENSQNVAVSDHGHEAVCFSFGANRILLTENAARDFLHTLAEYCFRKDLQEYPAAQFTE